MDIRSERSQDAATIRDLTRAAFEGETEAAIVDVLREAGALTLSLVAVEGIEIIGHVAFSPVRIGAVIECWYGLGPVSVRPDRRGRGVGQALIREGLHRLRQMGAAGVVVLGHSTYYGRFGFNRDDAVRYPGAPPEYFQRLAFTDAVPCGEVAYHRAFGAG